MNRINFNNYGGGIFHHLTPYRKKGKITRVKNEISKNVNTVVESTPIEDPVWRFGVFNGTATINRQQITNPCSEIPLKKTVEQKVTVINNPSSYKHKQGFRNYHKHQSFEIGTQSLSVSDSIGGCGMQQFYGWTSITNETVAYTLIDYYIKNRHNGVGLIICQLGQDYFNHHFEKALIRHDFKVISEYKNFMHGDDGRYKQRVYGLQLEINSIKRNERDD